MGDPVGRSFPLILLVGRPASGKSEIIDYLSRLPAAERLRRFHVGELQVLDDFPLLWSWIEEDQILEDLGKPRVHTDAEGYFRQPYLWDLLIRRLCFEYAKLRAASPELGRPATVILEFSRGAEHGGYAGAFGQLSEAVAAAACVLYVQVSFDESLRKNRRRFNPNQPHSILEHSLPDAKMERLYRNDDWSGSRGPWLSENTGGRTGCSPTRTTSPPRVESSWANAWRSCSIACGGCSRPGAGKKKEHLGSTRVVHLGTKGEV
jgi:hypothetical protein